MDPNHPESALWRAFVYIFAQSGRSWTQCFFSRHEAQAWLDTMRANHDVSYADIQYMGYCAHPC